MKRAFGAMIFCLVLATAANAADLSTKQNAPATRKDNVQDVIHGVSIADPYRWLEDQASPETRAWIDSQNTYTHSLLGNWPGREQLQKRFTELRKVDTTLLPIERNGRFFYRKRLAGQDQFVIYMRSADGKEEVLIDPHPMSANHTANVQPVDVSRDGKILMYMVRSGGKDEAEVRFFDVDARRDLDDRLPAQNYFSLSFVPDHSGLYYSLMTNDGPRVRFHNIGAQGSSDAELFGTGYNKEYIVESEVTEDGQHLILQVSRGSAGSDMEIWVQDLAKKTPIQPIVKGFDSRFYAFDAGNRLLLLTDWKAPNRRVLAVDYNKPDRDQWREIVPESGSPIEGVTPAAGRLLVSYVHNASSQIKKFGPDGKYMGEMKLPALGSVSGIRGRWSDKQAYFTFMSFVVPPTIYRYDVAGGRQSIWAQTRVPLDSSNIEVKQVWFTSKDGTSVPMFVVQKKGVKLDGNNPVLMHGYGGFTVSQTPVFSADAVLWVEHGGVFVNTNLRGGGEFGEAWHRAGMLDKKQNTFDDFIAASEWLINNKYTKPSKFAIWGGSNGGLLVGAALTQRPELYRAVICWHPLLDMVRYDQFMEAQFWVSEYGSAKDQQQFQWLYSYSPYHHVKSGTKYPAVLFMTGDGDTRVAPLHARKMAALLQAESASNLPVLLRYETAAGHSGGTSTTQDIADSTDRFAFLFSQLEMTP